MAGRDVRTDWFRSRAFARLDHHVRAMVETIALQLSLVADAAVAVRGLSEDGEQLVPLAAYDADPDRNAAMVEIMDRTESVREGLWSTIIRTGGPLRVFVDGTPAADASEPQRQFIAQHGIRAVLGAPVTASGRTVGGLALVRFSVSEPFSDDDERLVLAAADWVAAVLGFRAGLEGLRGDPPD